MTDYSPSRVESIACRVALALDNGGGAFPRRESETPDAVVRMHLVQALTRATNPETRKHIRIALDPQYNDGESFEAALDADKLNSEKAAALSLEEWLLRHATNGVSEVVLARVLQAYATQIEDLGYIPRSWGVDNHGLPRKPTGAGATEW